MSKKSSKTSHVLNLLTNRTGATIQDSEADNDNTQTQTAPPVSGDSSRSDSSGGKPTGKDSIRSDSSRNEPIASRLSRSDSPGSEVIRNMLSHSDFSGSEAAGRDSSPGQAGELPNPVLVEIAAPIRVAVSNPIIAELTGENPYSPFSIPPGSGAENNGQEKVQRKDQSVGDLIRTELERSYQNEQQGVPQKKAAASLEPQSLPEAPQSSAEATASLEPQSLPEAPQSSAETTASLEPQSLPEAPQSSAEAAASLEPQSLPEAPQSSAEATASLEPQSLPEAPQLSAEDQANAEREAAPPHIEEFTPDEFLEPEEAEGKDSFQPCYINVMDEIVRSNVMPIMKSMEMCTCSRCVNDVVALALNLLPPKYVVTQKGSLYAKVSLYEGQHRVDVFASITKACMEVKNNPRHHCSS